MTILLQLFIIIKLMLLFMSLLNILKEAFRFYKKVANKINVDLPKYNLLILGLSISYVLTLIFL